MMILYVLIGIIAVIVLPMVMGFARGIWDEREHLRAIRRANRGARREEAFMHLQDAIQDEETERGLFSLGGKLPSPFVSHHPAAVLQNTIGRGGESLRALSQREQRSYMLGAQQQAIKLRQQAIKLMLLDHGSAMRVIAAAPSDPLRDIAEELQKNGRL